MDPARPASVEDVEVRVRSRALLALLASGGAERDDARDALVRLHLPLVEHCAGRFRGRGEPHEDLVQVGLIGLLYAIDRFDPDRGLEFTTFATPTILGEIKKHFRDKGWAVRVPRRLQEMRARIATATADLAQRQGRPPTVRELAVELGCTVEEVVAGLDSANAYATLSLDAGSERDGGPPAALISLGVHDEALDHVEVRESIRPLLERLPPREKQILLLRFFRGMTQSQIAAEVGISQMHVSRLLSRTLERLRAEMEAPVAG